MNDLALELIQESLKEQKQMYAKGRRDAIYKLLDYYAGDNTAQYIEDRFTADAFKEIPVSFLLLYTEIFLRSEVEIL